MKKFIFILIFLLAFILVGCGGKTPSYTVRFYVEEELVKEETVQKGKSATAPEVSNLEEWKTFVGWDKEFSKVESDLDVNAIFDVETYVVTFYDFDENEIKSEIVEHGNSATAPELEDVEGYEFKGWDCDFSNVTSDLDVYPDYQTKKFTVRFLDEEGNELRVSSIAYGKSAVAPVPPQKKGYKFVKWDTDYKEVYSDMDVKPIYELATYTIKYYDGYTEIKGLTPTEYTIMSDASIDLPAGPEKEGYEFLGWYENDVRVVTFFASDAENKSYTAKYKELPKPMVIPSDMSFMFNGIKKVEHSSSAGTYLYQPDFTGLEVPAGATNYTWTSLHPDVATISQWSSISIVSPGYAIIRAQHTSQPEIVGYVVIRVNANGVYFSSIEEALNPVMYEVVFTDESGNPIDTQQVESGKNAVLPDAPKKEGYTFVGWSGEHYNIQTNCTFEPTYVQGESDLIGKTVSILGDSISTFKSHIPDGYSAFYPYPTADFGDVNQTWWMQVINNLGMKFHKNNSYSGSCVSTGTGSSGTTNDARLKELLKDGVAPDVIIIFMGANDCASASVSLTNFESSYKLMLDKIEVMCPNSEVYLLTLPSSGLYKDSEKVKYNNVIMECAKEYELNLIDLSNTYTIDTYKNYVVDSCHPNKAGMSIIARDIINGILKKEGIER